MKRAFLACSLLLVSCADRQSSLKQLGGQGLSDSISQFDLAEPGKLTIVNENNTPVPNATVMIGNKPGDPFEGNVMTTDASGQIHMPPNFKSELPMTVTATDYIPQTYLRFSPNGSLAKLHKKEGATRVEIKGTTNNYNGVVDGDGKVDFSMVIPAMSRSQLLAFDLSSVMSPENDTISIAGKTIQIPSNLALPEQSETYDIIVPVNLNKPDYRSYVRDGGSSHLTAVHGWFPLKKVVDDIRAGKSIFDVINQFQFVSMGSKDVNASANVTGQDINVSQSAMDATFKATAPIFDNTKVMLSLAMAEDNGRMTVTDLKRLTSKQTVNLKGSSQLSIRHMLSALMNNSSVDTPATEMGPENLLSLESQARLMFSLVTDSATPNFKQLSFTFQNEGDGAPTFMPLIAAPTINNGVLQLQSPALPSGMSVLGTYLVYSDILPSNGGTVKSETRTRLWELWHEGWINTVALPEVTFAKTPGHTYRWEVMFFATTKTNVEMATDGSAVNINDITHVTRNALNVN
jgi:hypothetical protein